MSGPLHRALATLYDAERTRAADATSAQARWADRAQRQFFDRIFTQLDTEAHQYKAALTTLDDQLRSALQHLNS
jgi:hypothetical protein